MITMAQLCPISHWEKVNSIPGQFDVVTVLDALYYFPDPEQQFMEIGRIVKAGGMFVFDVPGQAYLRLRGLLGAIAGMRRTRTFAAYPFYYSDQALRLFLDRAGFVIEKRLVDRGARHQSMLRNGMLFYTEMIKYLSSVLPRLFSFSPKVVYVARRK
ncbi:MAG: methyltransferase domain-containing protein [Anaerolineae bacterium]